MPTPEWTFAFSSADQTYNISGTVTVFGPGSLAGPLTVEGGWITFTGDPYAPSNGSNTFGLEVVNGYTVVAANNGGGLGVDNVLSPLSIRSLTTVG